MEEFIRHSVRNTVDRYLRLMEQRGMRPAAHPGDFYEFTVDLDGNILGKRETPYRRPYEENPEDFFLCSYHFDESGNIVDTLDPSAHGVIIDAEHVKLQMCPHYIPKPEGYGLADTVQHMKDTNAYRMKLLRTPGLLETINRELRAVDDIYFERYMTFLDRKQPSFYEEALIRQGAIQRGEPVNLVQGAGYFAPIRL